MRSLLTTLVFLLPNSRLKRGLLNRLGHQIHPVTYVGINLVRNVRRFELAEGSGIGNFNIIGGIDRVVLGVGSRINYLNMIQSGYSGPAESSDESVRGALIMGEHARIVTLHILDCSGGIVIGDDCWVTGMRSTFLSHVFDPTGEGILVEPIRLEKGSVVATNCTLLAGSVVGEGALLAAGSTLWTRQQIAAENLHGGVPARRLAPIKISDWVYSWQRYGGPAIAPSAPPVEDRTIG